MRIQIKFYSSYIGIRNVMLYENICVARIILNVQREQEAQSVNTRGVIEGHRFKFYVRRQDFSAITVTL